VKVEGLSRVDEPALNALNDAAFIKLRKASALISFAKISEGRPHCGR
jgi:hypothetical protein